MTGKKGFRLEKHYFDSIDDSGNCFIVYLAKLEFYFLRFWYSGLIFSAGNDSKTEKSVFGKIEFPVPGKLLKLKLDKLGIEGTWKAIDAPFLISLFKDEKCDELIWNCHHPKASAEIMYNNETFKGTGYAETLILQIRPFNLPVEELRWGRFLSDTATVIWINWKGSKPLNKLFFNGTEYNDAEFGNNKITFGDKLFRLSFSQVRIIRKGTITNLFSGMPVLKTIIRSLTLKTVETKYTANTTFSRNSIFLSKGWSIYEDVIWGGK